MLKRNSFEPSALKITFQGVSLGLALAIIGEKSRSIHPILFSENIIDACESNEDLLYCSLSIAYSFPYVLQLIVFYSLTAFVVCSLFGFLFTSAYVEQRFKNLVMLSITASIFGGSLLAFIWIPNARYWLALLFFIVILSGLVLGNHFIRTDSTSE